MQQSWISGEKLRPANGRIDWSVDYGAHPMLDPDFTSRPSRLLRFAQMSYERILDDDLSYCRETARLLRPLHHLPGASEACPGDIRQVTDYLRESDAYLASAIRLLPDGESRRHVRPLDQVTRTDDLRELLGLAFHAPDQRLRFEAVRKVYLAKLLLDITHSHHVVEGLRHLEHFDELLKGVLWRHTLQVHELIVGFHIGEDGDSIRYTSRPGDGDSRWHFQSIFLEKTVARRKLALDILYYNCRFKRSVDPLSFEIVDGQHRVLERVRWGEMRHHTSGSILSKMIRKGINNPDEVADLLGAMFIVHDEEALNDLLSLLDAGLGTPFGWRNVTDTLAARPEGVPLNRHSGRGFRVFKGDLDLLVPDRDPQRPPYRYSVEIQIHTLESFLRTVCGQHEASHLALKLRQFLFGLVPVLFPAKIYGTEWLRLD
ncbi:MAG: hypothetical protein R6X25_09285 [Candidatus Krumholzibacteriia bacterium]